MAKVIAVIPVARSVLERLMKSRGANLVQKRVEVKTRNGNHYRMQWVKPENDVAGVGRGQMDLFAGDKDKKDVPKPEAYKPRHPDKGEFAGNGLGQNGRENEGYYAKDGSVHFYDTETGREIGEDGEYLDKESGDSTLGKKKEYPLPKTIGEVGKEWMRAESPLFEPTESQRRLMDEVKGAISAIEAKGDYPYNDTIIEYVGNKMKDELPHDFKERGKGEVSGGLFGYAIYHARQALEAETRNSKDAQASQKHGFQNGMKLPAIKLSGKTIRGAIVSNVDSVNSHAQPAIEIQFTSGGKKMIARVTARMLGDAVDEAPKNAKPKASKDQDAATSSMFEKGDAKPAETKKSIFDSFRDGLSKAFGIRR